MTGQTNTLDILYQDIHTLQEQFTGVAQQVDRIQRTIKIDERIAAVADKHSQAELMAAVAANTDLVSSLLKEIRQERHVDNGNGFYLAMRREQEDTTDRHIRFDRRLTRCEQRIIPKCPCGKHKGILFLEKSSDDNTFVGDHVYMPGKRKYGTITMVNGKYLKVLVNDQEVKTEKMKVCVVIDKRCPSSWWVTQVKIATLDGVGTQFVNSTPRSVYLKGYNLI